MEEYTSGIFFDNDADHITAVGHCSSIKCIKVGAIEDSGTPLTAKFPRYVDYYHLLSDDGQFVYDEMLDTSFYMDEQYDPQSGIQAKHVEDCREWLEATKDEEKRIALFDFDRTLSLFEGIDQRIPERRYVTIEGYSNYLFGGKKRVQMLKDMLDMLVDKNVTIKILTNNGLCGSPNKIIEKLVNTLYTEAEIICSRPPDGSTTEEWHSSKLSALMKDLRFTVLCPPTSGGKINKKKRRNTMKKSKSKKLTRQKRHSRK